MRNLPLKVRTARLDDAEKMLSLEEVSGPKAFKQGVHQLRYFLSKRGHVSVIVEQGVELVGFLLATIRLHRQEVHLGAHVIHPCQLHDATYLLLLNHLLTSLPHTNPPLTFSIRVDELDTRLQLLLKGQGFVCTRILGNYLGDESEPRDAYLFSYTQPPYLNLVPSVN